MPSSEGVPVEVVGRPSMGEGRTPGDAGAGDAIDATVGILGTSSPGGARESAMFRFRNAIVCMSGLEM